MIDARILLLAFGTFAIGTEGYAIAGLLPMISEDLHVSVAACGQLVTIFALSYALGGPPLVVWLDSLPRKRLIVLALIGFSLANLLAAMARSWALLACARVLAALAASLFMAPASAAAVTLSPPEKRGQALSVTATGNALALALGAPLGTMTGTVCGWQGAFMLVALLGGVAAVGVALMLPSIPRTTSVSFGSRFTLVRQSSVRRGLSVSFGLFVCALTAYTYLTPLAHSAAGMNSRWVAVLMIIFGAAGTVAGVGAGLMIDHYGSRRMVLVSLGIMVGLFSLLGGLAALHHSGTVETAVMILLVAFWGGAWWSGGIAQQHRMTDMAPGQHAAILALHYSMQFLGISVGGALGGLVLAFVGTPEVAFSAAVIGMITLLAL